MERSRILSLLLVICMILSMSPAAFAAPDGETQDRLVLQDLDYTENPVDIPNPDRGFERGNDDAAGCGVDNGLYGYMTVPASEDTILGQTFQLAYEMEPPLYLGGPTVDAEYCGVPVTPNIVQFYLVLNNFSSNAWCDSEPGNPSAHDRTGVDGPITEYGLNFIREQLDFIRNNTSSVAHIRVCYDPKGWNQYVWTADNLLYEDAADPGSDRYYYPADYTRPVAPEDRAAHIAEPVAGTWRGSSPVFRMCTVPGYEDLNWVQYHYLQLKPIFEEYSDIIWAFDSGTFGPWGESHSNYEAEVSGHYKMLLDCLLDAVPDNKPIMTHIGGFLDWYNRTYDTTYTFGTLDQVPTPEPGTPEARFGMFDDSNGFSADEYSYGDNGSLTEGYRMLAHDPILPGYDPDAVDPSLTRAQEGAPGGKVSSIIGYNTTGTNRLMEVPEELDDPRWRGVWFVDWDRTKVMDFLSRMSVYGGEQIGNEPDTASNGKYVPVGERLLPENEAVNDVILRFPSMFYEHSIARYTYLCMQQGSKSFKSRADIEYNRENIEVEITYPWNGKTVQVLYDPVYEGQSALAYYRDRLGYRLVLREAYANETVSQNENLEFEGKIQNVGWGDIFNEKAVKVILKSPVTGAVSEAVLTDIDPRDWQPADPGPNGEMPDSRATNTEAWRSFSFSIPMEEFGDVPTGQYNIYLKITDPKETTANKRSIRFANKGDNWDEELGANLVGSTLVISSDITSDDGCIAFARATVERGTYTAARSQALTENQAAAKVYKLLDDMDLKGVEVEVNRVGFVPATTSTDGKFVFTVTLSKGEGTPVETGELTLNIKAGSSGSGGGGSSSGSSGGNTTDPGETSEPLPFVDVKSDDWYYEAVAYAYKNELMNGVADTIFAPSGETTRAMIVTILYRQAGSPSVVSDGTAWYSDARAWAMEQGISDGTNMQSPITREQMATMLYRYAGKNGMDVSRQADLSAFSDADRISGFAKDAIRWAVGSQILLGKNGGVLDPRAGASRGEAAAMLMRFCEAE